MKIVVRGASVYLLDKTDRIVTLSPPMSKLADIYTANWKNITDTVMQEYDYVLIDKVSSFKGLKHYVTGYICVNKMDTSRVPVRYIKSYEMNKHLYTQTINF